MDGGNSSTEAQTQVACLSHFSCFVASLCATLPAASVCAIWDGTRRPGILLPFGVTTSIPATAPFLMLKETLLPNGLV